MTLSIRAFCNSIVYSSVMSPQSPNPQASHSKLLFSLICTCKTGGLVYCILSHLQAGSSSADDEEDEAEDDEGEEEEDEEEEQPPSKKVKVIHA